MLGNEEVRQRALTKAKDQAQAHSRARAGVLIVVDYGLNCFQEFALSDLWDPSDPNSQWGSEDFVAAYQDGQEISLTRLTGDQEPLSVERLAPVGEGRMFGAVTFEQARHLLIGAGWFGVEFNPDGVMGPFASTAWYHFVDDRRYLAVRLRWHLEPAVWLDGWTEFDVQAHLRLTPEQVIGLTLEQRHDAEYADVQLFDMHVVPTPDFCLRYLREGWEVRRAAQDE